MIKKYRSNISKIAAKAYKTDKLYIKRIMAF